MVMAVEDNMVEDMEELVLYGMTEGMAGEVTGEVKLCLWDAAVPALPVIAQLPACGVPGRGRLPPVSVGGSVRQRRFRSLPCPLFPDARGGGSVACQLDSAFPRTLRGRGVLSFI